MSGCALLLAASETAAAARPVVYPESFAFEAELPPSDGYLLHLRSEGHRRISLDIDSKDLEQAYVTMSYATRGRVDRHGIEADFGQFGRVDLRFSGPAKRSTFRSPNCESGKPEVRQSGALEGDVEFESLGGVVKLTTHRLAEGTTWHSPRRTCTPPTPSDFASGGPDLWRRSGPGKSATGSLVKTLLARANLMGRTIDLYLASIENEVIDLAATSTRRFGPVLVSTGVHAPEDEAAGPGKAVELSIAGSGPRPRGAGLSAPSPFSGTATYRKAPGSPPSWLGSLAVEIPGEGTLPLAGPDFHAVLCAYVSHERERACERTVAPPHLVG